jgi:5-methylcytosine-specific restriction endonuclease McrA
VIEPVKRDRSRRPIRGPFVCRQCSAEYWTRQKSGEGEKYCSRACAFKRPELRVRLSPIRDAKKVASDLARKKREAASSLKAAAAVVPCKVCGNRFTRSLAVGYKYCGPDCADAGYAATRKKARSNSVAIHGRLSKHIQRARRYGVAYEAIDPAAIFDRDGWRCKRCGVDTPATLRGTLSAEAPELDHVVPISRGGGHLVTNVQCLCRRCNIEKADTMPPEADGAVTHPDAAVADVHRTALVRGDGAMGDSMVMRSSMGNLNRL